MKYNITVKPGSSQEKILSTSPTELTVYLRAKAHDGEANSALIKLLSKHFHVAKTNITIVSGTKSRHKILDIPTIINMNNEVSVDAPQGTSE